MQSFFALNFITLTSLRVRGGRVTPHLAVKEVVSYRPPAVSNPSHPSIMLSSAYVVIPDRGLQSEWRDLLFAASAMNPKPQIPSTPD